MAKGLVAPENLVIDFAPSPRQYELWKMLQPDYCPHCGGHIIQTVVGKDIHGKNIYKPQCENCQSFDLPQIILGGGAAGGGKSYLASCWIVSSCMRFPDLRAVIARKTIKSLKESTFNTVKTVMRDWGLKEGENYKINNQVGEVTFWNNSTIILKELEDLPSDTNFERLGSSEFTIAAIDEVSEISEKAVEVLFSRLRWRTHESFKYPRLLMTTNPCITWVRSRFVQDDDGNPVKCAESEAYVPFSVFDNPNEKFTMIYRAALEKITDPATKARLLYGNWDFVDTNEVAAYWQFKGNQHLVDGLREKVYDPLKPVVLSFDFNVAPYMSCLALQFDYNEKKVYVLNEYLGRPEEKQNNTPAFAKMINQRLLTDRHMGGVILTGDPAGQARSTQTEDGVNNYTIIKGNFNSALNVRQNILNRQPPQVTRLEFINSVFAGYAGWSIYIDMRCRKFTEDLIYQKKNQDGTKCKAKVTDSKLGMKYEKYGHLSDCFDYALCLMLANPWRSFQYKGDSGIYTVNSPHIYGDFEY
jgi:PBSX family phage terminase large subunit